MSHKADIRIDHRKAVIVELMLEGERITIIESKVEKHLERGGDSPLKGRYEARQVPADDRRQQTYTGELTLYYDVVIAALPNHGSLLLFGPGEAKGELHKQVSKIKPEVRVSTIETADQMTDRQIIAKVRAHFGLAAPRVQ